MKYVIEIITYLVSAFTLILFIAPLKVDYNKKIFMFGGALIPYVNALFFLFVVIANLTDKEKLNK